MKVENQIIGIDASNIIKGGGITHLSELLNNVDPVIHGIQKVIIWSNSKTLEQLPEKPWLLKKNHLYLEKNIFYRLFWHKFILASELLVNHCNLLFVPGGSYSINFKPIVTMNQNLLPFENNEILRYKFSLSLFRLLFLRFFQTISFKKSNGLIFLSLYSKKIVEKVLKSPNLKSIVIPHGVNKRFFKKPRIQKSIIHYSEDNPYRIIYISSIDLYKHHWNVAQAVSRLKKLNYPIVLDIYGGGSTRQSENLIKRFSEFGDAVCYKSEVNHINIQEVYFSADLSIFASSCETFGQIIIESMASGLPIACSKMSTMPELLGDSAIYFDPLDINDIQSTIKTLIDSEITRNDIAIKAYEKAQQYTWTKTSYDTFEFFKEVIKEKYTHENINS
tara:strand:+ start:435 stop:1604 length:1170 start_codon:yes stop_codon:yes gene_type:complete